MSHPTQSNPKLPRGTVAMPAAAIALMTLVLATGFQTLGLMDRIDQALLGWIGSSGIGAPQAILPAWIGWITAVLIGFALPMAILETPTHWRRTLLWISTGVVVAGLWPVLALASKWWPQAPAAVAVVWSGLCAKVYASRHVMPCEGGDAKRRPQRPRKH